MSVTPKTTASTMMPQFLAACPAFAPKWEAHLAYWGDDGRGDFIDITELAHFVVESFKEKKTECFAALFDRAEAFLRTGSLKQREIITIGLLEDIQTIASHQPFGSDAFLPFLGPLSRQAWNDVARQWDGKSSLMDIVREKGRAQPDGTDNSGAAPRRV